MIEKKNFIVNCDVCDARKITQDELSQYEKIMINASILLIDERSKAILNQLPIACNTDETLEIEGDVDVISVNGDYEINGSVNTAVKSVLTVNGNLVIRPNTEDRLKRFVKIIVNGSVRCPKSLAPWLDNLSVNGNTEYIPDDCIVLKPEFEIDKYFPLRAEENGKYYVSNKVVLKNSDIDIEMLVAKNVRFETKRFICAEKFVSKAIELIDESVELKVIPTGDAFVGHDATLDEMLLQKYGKYLYVDGNLTLNAQSTEILHQLEKLYVNGDIYLLKNQTELFKKLNAEYEKIILIKGCILKNKMHVTIDTNLLNAMSDGITVTNCNSLEITEDISTDSIINLLDIVNCIDVKCSPLQRSAVELVSKNVAHIISDETEDVDNNTFNIMQQLENTKVVNANKYIL